MPEIDIDAYLHRIGMTGPLEPDFETLASLLQNHMFAIPFENIDILLGKPVKLDLMSLQRKLVQERRGGHCFEHVTLLGAALVELGFEITCHLARVLLTGPKYEAPRTHMFALVTLPEGQYVLDPGLGGASATCPIALVDARGTPAERHSSHWFVREGSDWILRSTGGGREMDLWATELTTDFPVDFALANYFVATSPESNFTRMLMMNSFRPNGRISVINMDATVRQDDEASTRRIGNERELQSFISDQFGMHFTDIVQIYAAISPVPTPSLAVYS